LLLLWTLLFAFLTLQDGSDTVSTGLGFANWLKSVFALPQDAETLHLLLRKAAHLICMAGESLLLYLTLRAGRIPVGKSACISLACCLVLAVLSEAVKIPIPGRHFSWRDSGLNALGAVAGAAAGLVCSARRRRMKN